MFETIINFFKKFGKHETKETASKDKAKERLHLVLMQDRANVSADFLEMMKQEIIEVIKKYIEVEENAIDVRLTNEIKEDGTTGAPSLYANIPILNIRNEMKKEVANKENKEENKEKAKPSDETNVEENKEEEKQETENNKKAIKENKEAIEEKQEEKQEDKKNLEDKKELEEVEETIDSSEQQEENEKNKKENAEDIKQEESKKEE